MLAFDLSLQQWAAIGQIVTALGVVLVLVQIRQGARSSRVELITGMTTLILEVDRMFVEYPEMRKYFEDGAIPPADDTEQSERARAVAMTMADVFDHVTEHMGFMEKETQRAWRACIAETHGRSPVFKELIESHGGWWPRLQREVQQRPVQGPRANAQAELAPDSNP